MTKEIDLQRKYPRYEVQAIAKRPRDPQPSSSNVKNLSLGGICIECSEVQEIGSHIEIGISFPALGGNVSVLCEVIWANRREPKEMGLRFVSLDETSKNLLNQHLEIVYDLAHKPEYIV